MENKIRIPNPCNENWNSMSHNKKGRFCNSCNKTVIDFTKMKQTEIQKYFTEKSDNKSICGYYKFNQVENKNNTKYSNLRNRFNRIKIKPIKVIALFLLTFIFTFSSCMMGKRAEESPEDEIENDTINQNKINNKVENTEIKKDSIKSKNIEIKEQK